VLGGAVWFAVASYGGDPIGSPFILGLIWWSVHKVTWDCTFIDETVDDSGKGLLDAVGLEKPADPEADGEAPAAPDEPEPAARDVADPPGLLGWWTRYERYRAAQLKKPHTPGVWVVYFSLAALPLFGLGQSLIPAGDLAQRRYTLWLMVCYVGSGLGLLLTTSFLG